MFLNILVFVVATLYWYFSGHYVPAVLGYAFVAVFIYRDELYFTSYLFGISALLAIIYFFYYDYVFYQEGDGVLHFGTGIFYMIVIFFKSYNIFENDD